jgi:hypothetical protein
MNNYPEKLRPVRITRKTMAGAFIVFLFAVFYYNLIFLGPVTERPEEFDIVFTYGYGPGNTLDTRDNTYISRLTDPKITIEISMTEEELDKIWKTIQQHHFYELEPQNPAYAESVQPVQKYTLTVYTQGYSEKTVSMAKLGPQTLSEFRFFKITNTIQNIIENKPEYKALPEPRGGYA